jgi:hypothetical protein
MRVNTAQAFEPTSEQRKIISEAKSGHDLVIQALAGTGKTTTLKLLAESLFDKRGTYIAFNKAIVDEAASKFPENVRCKTAHSLAYGAIGYKYKDRLTLANRVTVHQVAEWLNTPRLNLSTSKSKLFVESDQVADLVLKTVTNFCKSTDLKVDKKHVELPFYIDMRKKHLDKYLELMVPFALKCWDDLQGTEGFLKFTHDYYLKLWQLNSPRIKGDFILFDEAQDADPVMLDIIESQTHAQKIFCGDQYQAIYEWRGAKNALANVDADKTLWLTQSFRFGKKIADEANDILDFLEAPVKVVGSPKIDSLVKQVTNPKAILCRTNAGVIQQLLFELQKGRRVSVIGRTEELIFFTEACQKLQRGIRTGHPELAPFETWNEVKAYAENYPDEAQEIRTMIDLIDKFGAVRLLEAIRKVVPESDSDVLISTAHRAKGREWESVKLAGDFLHPRDMEEEDLRLAYVSVTRAIKALDMSEWALIRPKDDYDHDQVDTKNIGTEYSLLNSIVGDKPNRSGARWLYEEDLLLVTKAISGENILEIAIDLERSDLAIYARLARWLVEGVYGAGAEEITLRLLADADWDDSKLEQLNSTWNADLEISEIAARLGVSTFQVALEVIKNELIEYDDLFYDAVRNHYQLEE